jgi:hypothetical protein
MKFKARVGDVRLRKVENRLNTNRAKPERTKGGIFFGEVRGRQPVEFEAP